MSKLTSYADYMATLPADSQQRITEKTKAMIERIEQENAYESQEVTITLPSNIMAWLRKHGQAGQDLPTQINHLLDEAILNHA